MHILNDAMGMAGGGWSYGGMHECVAAYFMYLMV